MTWRNILVLPLALLVRTPIMLLAYGLSWLGQHLESVGRAVPGLDRPLATPTSNIKDNPDV